MAWLKLTSKALYLMKGGTGDYLQKVDLQPFTEKEKMLNVPLEWFQGNSSDIPRGMVVSFRPNSPEPEPEPYGATLNVTSYPKAGVKAMERFAIEGTTDPSNAGKAVILTIDTLKVTGPPVTSNGQWRTLCSFSEPGERTINITVGGESVDLVISVFPPDPPRRFNLSGSVGKRGVNASTDVLAVKRRLMALGFNWIQENGTVDAGTIRAIQLFQAIINRQYQVGGAGVDGRVDPNGFTHGWLQAQNAPRWQQMPVQGEGFFNYEVVVDTTDNHDYGTSWMAETIVGAGKTYQASYRKTRPQSTLIVINDVSVPYGGDTPDHATHETGLSCDILLPRQDGQYGSITWTSASYDRDTMRAILKSIRQQPLVGRVLFNDEQLIREGLCQRATGHDNHAHFDIKPPARIN